MSSRLRQISARLIAQTNYETHRYLFESFNAENRLTGLVGPRGVGKTTMMLQYIKEKVNDKSVVLYFSADNIFFNQSSLFEYIADSYELDGISSFFIDEIHKYANWNQELKNIYDSFPEVTIVFSGSSSVDLIRGAYDLSRRGILRQLNGLSFREYLNFTLNTDFERIEFNDLITGSHNLYEQLSEIPQIRKHFKDYIEKGYYPFFNESEATYHERIGTMLNKIIYEDIAEFYQLKTTNLHLLKDILTVLATIPPGDINLSNLAKTVGADVKTIRHYLDILKETNVIRIINPPKSGSALVRKSKKLFLSNASLYHALCDALGKDPRIGVMRESFFVSMIENSGLVPEYLDKGGDFKVNDSYFEIGGKNKDRRQLLKNNKSSFLVKDDVIFGSKYEIPLYLFGFLY